MNITVINGSPKPAQLSVTHRPIRLLQKRFPGHTWRTVSPGPLFTALQKEPQLPDGWREAVEQADLLIWATPVYYLTVPSQLQRFIKAIRAKERWRNALAGKVSAVLTTSIHYYDHLAIDWLESTLEDMDLRLLSPLSLEMNDIMEKKGRTKLFTRFMLWSEETAAGSFLPRRTRPLQPYHANKPALPEQQADRTDARQITLLTDGSTEQTTLTTMIDNFCTASPDRITVYNLNELGIQGGCTGCLRCGWDNTCSYRDGLKEFIEEKCIPAEGLVFALRTEGRGFSSLFKAFRDRSFVFNHVPYFKHKPTLWLISGPLSQLPGLQEVIAATCEAGEMGYAGSISDEAEPHELGTHLTGAAVRLHRMIETELAPQETFRTVGGRKLFRDFVYLNPVFRRDRSYYRKQRMFDFPQKKRGLRLGGAVIRLLLHIPPFRRKVYSDMSSFMLQNMDRMIERLEKGADGTTGA